MTTRTDTLKVVYVVDGQSNVIGSFRAVGKEADALDRRVASAGKSMDGAAESGARMGKVLGVGIGAAITATAVGMGIYIRNTIEAEKVQAQLAARIRDTGNAAGRSLEQLNAQAKALQQTTLFDDNAVGGAQAALMVFREIEGLNFDRAVELSADLATKWNTDMPTAAERLGTALANPERGLRALASAGVEFSKAERESIKEMVEHGRTAEVVTVILDRLEGTIGSTAEAAADTLGGAFGRLKNQVSSLLQGDSGTEGMVGLRQSVEDLIDLLADPRTEEAIDNTASGILKIANAAITAVTEVDDLLGWLQRAATFEMGGTKDVTDLAQIRYEIQRNEENISEWSDKEGFGFRMAQKKAEKRLAELREMEAMSLRLFGEPGAPQLRIIDPRDAASMQEDRHLRRARGGAVLPPATPKGPTEEEKAAAEWMKDQLAMEKVWADTRAEHANAATQWANEQAEAIERGRAQTQALIGDMEFELSLIGMTNEERAKATALRYADGNATEEQRNRIAGLAEELERAYEAERVIDGVKGAMIDLAAEIDSTGDAAEDFGERMVRMARRLLAEKAVQALFNLFQPGYNPANYSDSSGLAGMGSFELPTPHAKGAAFNVAPPSLHSYLNQVHNQPRMFAFASGGIFAEAGPEAIMPLERGPDGSLGVRNYGSGVGDVNVNVYGAQGQPKVDVRSGPKGLDIDILFDGFRDRLAGEMGSGSGSLYQATKGRFNLSEPV